MLLATLLALSTTTAHAADGDLVDVASKNGSFDTLVAAVTAAGLVETLQGAGPYTVFAPTDEAFGALPAGTLVRLLKPENKDELVGILTYHVVPGAVMAADVKSGKVASVQGSTLELVVSDGKVMVDEATVVTPDVKATNGVIHVIDKVVLPTPPPPEVPPVPETNTIVDVAMGAGMFDTLLAAAKAADLVETLQGEGPYTVFAPTDEAFAALGSTVDDLLKPENKAKLKNILLYHVTPGRVMAGDLGKGRITMVGGGDVKVKTKKGTTSLNKSVTVVKADIEADNGVVHVIDGVLLP